MVVKQILFFILLPVLFIYTQEQEIKKLFPGKWKLNVNNSEVYEEWIMESETELTGKSYSINNGVQDIGEVLFLKKFAEIWAYVAIPEGQNITLFKLIKYSSNKFVFENEEHDFPQRIIYEFSDDDKLSVAIEGIVNGKMKRKEFNYITVND